VLISRNLDAGVYDAVQRGFIGIRTKFGSRFLDIEYHYDDDAERGTAHPIVVLEKIPDHIIVRASDATTLLHKWMIDALTFHREAIHTAQDLVVQAKPVAE
jgi:hypothetical protein